MTKAEALFLVSAAVASAMAGLMLPPEPVAANSLEAVPRSVGDDRDAPFSVTSNCLAHGGRFGGPGARR